MAEKFEQQAVLFHMLVKKLGKSQRAVARLLELDQRLFRAYVSGTKKAPERIRLALKALVMEST